MVSNRSSQPIFNSTETFHAGSQKLRMRLCPVLFFKRQRTFRSNERVMEKNVPVYPTGPGICKSWQYVVSSVNWKCQMSAGTQWDHEPLRRWWRDDNDCKPVVAAVQPIFPLRDTRNPSSSMKSASGTPVSLRQAIILFPECPRSVSFCRPKSEHW